MPIVSLPEQSQVDLGLGIRRTITNPLIKLRMPVSSSQHLGYRLFELPDGWEIINRTVVQLSLIDSKGCVRARIFNIAQEDPYLLWQPHTQLIKDQLRVENQVLIGVAAGSYDQQASKAVEAGPFWADMRVMVKKTTDDAVASQIKRCARIVCTMLDQYHQLWSDPMFGW